MTKSFRMICKGHEFNGYVFADEDHARTWLEQVWVDLTSIMLEPVEVSELHRCRSCGGRGYHQTVKATGPRQPATKFMKDRT